MLLFPNTRIELSTERALLAGVAIENEGSALVAGYVGGVFGVQESLGVANEKFVGVSLSRPLTPGFLPAVEVLTVPASGVITLRSTPLANTVRVVKVSTGAAYTVVAGAPAAATEAQVTGANANVVFQTSQANTQVAVHYVRTLTTVQAVLLQGNQDIGGPAGAYFGQVGVITRGDVFTTEYDTLVDWSTPGNLTLGANGKFTLGGTGVDVPGYVISAPSEGNAWLGLHFSAV